MKQPALKYIIVRDGEYEFPVMFANAWAHSDVARKLRGDGQSVIGAGFVMTDDGGRVVCSGRSSSLGISSRPERDAAVIRAWLAGT
ncbi:MAG: hypothetical protein WCF85_19860 [Rhodospirillaceae bacterium]